jgi:hypothetical protein
MPGEVTPPSAGGASALIALTDTPAGYGSNGQVLTSNGVDAAAWQTPGAAFAWPSSDWRSAADAGIGTSTAIDLATDLPDLSTIDAGTALRKRALVGGRAIIAPTEGTAFVDAAGVKVAEVAAGDFTVAVALDTLFDGVTFNSSTIQWAQGLVCFDGTDPAADKFSGGGSGRTSDALHTAPLLVLEDSGLGGRDTYRVVLEQTYTADLNEGLSLCITRQGNIVKTYAGNGKTWVLLRGLDRGYAGASLIAVLTSCSTAVAVTETAISNWLVWDDGHANAGQLPGWV